MFTRLIQTIIIVLFTSVAVAFANGNISVSAKESEDHIFLIFHHDRNTTLTPSFLGSNGRVRSSHPITLKPDYNALVAKLCNSIAVSPKDKHLIDFKLNDKYRFLKTIHGEKLVAFKISNPDYKSSDKSTIDADTSKVEEVKASEVYIQDTIKAQSGDKQNADTLVGLSESKGALQMTFPFKAKDVGASVFARGSDLWVVFDSRQDFYIPANGNIASWKQYTDLNNTILKITLQKNLTAQVSKDGANWRIKLSSSASKLQTALTTEVKGDSLLFVNDINKVSQIILVRDPDVGDLLAIAPIPAVGVGIAKERGMVDYKILSSSQGLAISLISEDVKVSYSAKEKAVEIVSSYKMPEKTTGATSGADLKTILPLTNSKMLGDDFLFEENLLTRAIVSSKDDATTFNAQYDLAQFYFSAEMYHEALGMLTLAEKTDATRMTGLTPGLTKAVSMVMTGDNIDARTVFADLKSNYKNSPSIAEVNIWDRYNEFKLGSHPESIGVLDNKYLMAQYCDEFYWQLMFAEMEIASERKNFKLIDGLLSAARSSDDLHINNNLKFYKSQYYYLQGQTNLAEQLLKEIEGKPANGHDFMMADLQLVKILYEQRKLDWISAVQRLHELRFTWRGGSLELKLLTSLALAYKQNGDVINAIRTYKYIIDAFGKQGNNNFFVTSQIVELYNRIFLSDEMQELDDFTVIALFYEFKDYTPIGADGDRAVLGIARRMLNLDLLDMAIDILQHQVTYRLRGVDRIITANHLALVYLMDKKPADALRVMAETDKENTNFAGYKQRNELKAKALIDLGKYQEALDYMKDDPSEDAVALRSEAYFKANRWSDYIALIEPVIKKEITAGDVIKGDDSQDVLRLAISYSMLSRLDDLDYLSHNIVTENKDLKTVIDFLKDTNKPINPHSVDKSLNIDRMKDFVDHQKELLFN